MKLLLVRHPTPAMAAGLCYGRLDVPLHRDSDLEALARTVAAACPARVWTSPARRCRALAAIVAARCGTTEAVDPRLKELDFGAWEGLAWSEVPRPELDRWAAAPLAFTPPGGESMAALIARVGQFCEAVRDRGEDAVVVTHGGPLRIMPALLRGHSPDLLAPAPPFGSVLTLELPASSCGQPAQDDALGQDGASTQHVAGVAADLPPGQRREGQRGGEG